MPKPRTPSSKSSWIGMAAHEIEIDELTTYGSTFSAARARDLANAVDDSGQDLLHTDPRSLARANYSAEAGRARIGRENAEAARIRQVLGEDDFVDMLNEARTTRRLAA